MIISEKANYCNYLNHQVYERRFLGFSFYQCKLCSKRMTNRTVALIGKLSLDFKSNNVNQ